MTKEKQQELKKGELTPEELDVLKKKHGNIHKITIEDGVGYLKEPTRKEISDAQMNHAAMVHANSSDVFTYKEQLFDACWLCGDESIHNDEKKQLAAFGVLDKLGSIPIARLEKV